MKGRRRIRLLPFFISANYDEKTYICTYSVSKIMKIVFILLVILLPLFSLAQQSDSQLAYTYYQNKDYEKAAQLFLQLYERTHASNFLDYHIICLINGKQYDQAEEVLKKYLKTDSRNKDYIINLGYIYEQQGKSKKAEEYYEKAIKTLIPHSSDINSLAYKFRNIREYGWAIKTYQHGQKLLKQPHAFLSELGENYMMERNYEQMLDLFVQILQTKPTEINNIISKLNFSRSYDIINSVDGVIENKLAELFQQSNYNPVFDELAVWYALQKKDYAQALHHAVLLNQKSPDKGYIYLNIARSAASLGNYNLATEAFNKILEKGKENNNLYTTALKESISCEYEKYQQQKAKQELYLPLATTCKNYLHEYGYTSANTDIALLLSDLYAYQIHQPDSANIILEKCTKIRSLNTNLLSEIKSKRADLLTYMDNPWEATILYTQIEKSNPNNDTGYEAKLKKAWLAYYAGDLLWAKAQFDVLKGSTTKLISNDAIKMSHFINMNYETDGDNKELVELAAAEFLIYKQQYQKALRMIDSVILHSPPGIADYASLQKAKVLCQLSDYPPAIEIFSRLKEQSEQTYIRAEAIYELANLKKQLEEYTQARELYKTLVSEYSGSVYSVEAGNKYREMEK